MKALVAALILVPSLLHAAPAPQRRWPAPGVRAITLSPDGMLTSPLGPEVKARAAAISPDGKLIALADPEGVSLRELATGRETLRLPPKTGQVTSLAFAYGGRVLAIGHSDRIVRLWDIPGRRVRAELVPAKARGL